MPLIYLILGSLAEHSLILTVVVKPLQVLLALLLYLVEHVIALTQSVPPFNILFGLLLAHGGLELVTIGPCLARFLILHILLLLLEDLLLELDNGAPFIDATLCILRVVPLVVISEYLQFFSLMLHGLLHTLSMHPQRINQVVSHLLFFYSTF